VRLLASADQEEIFSSGQTGVAILVVKRHSQESG
jgi:hypothetical protein